MITVIQLVKHANVSVEAHSIGAIQRGICAFIGIEKTDTLTDAQKMVDRILNYRIFPDAERKMNLSIKNIEGGLLLVPQFTLVAETTKGTRPGFSLGMAPELSKTLFTSLVDYAKTQYKHVACGKFGAHMEVTLCNDGPVTFILRST